MQLIASTLSKIDLSLADSKKELYSHSKEVKLLLLENIADFRHTYMDFSSTTASTYKLLQKKSLQTLTLWYGWH